MKIITKLFTGGIGGIFIGLFMSMFFSYLNTPDYLPLNPHSPMGSFLIHHHVHVVFIMLYCMLIWFLMGALFQGYSVFFEKDWSLLRSLLTHYFLMLVTFLFLSNAAGFFSTAHLISILLNTVVNFSIVYLCVWIFMYYKTYAKIKKINQDLTHRKSRK